MVSQVSGQTANDRTFDAALRLNRTRRQKCREGSPDDQ
jgi:hypothetical protein